MSLAELEFDHNLFSARTAGDSKLLVRFFHDILPDEEASAATGIRKFRDAEFVQIMVPGDKRNITIREVRDDDRTRFAKQYDMFKAGAENQVTGYPLKEWPLATRAVVEELKYLGFTTVEQVAEASDGIVGKYPGLRELQRRAQNWLQAQTSAAPMERLQNELATRDAQIKALQDQIAALATPAKTK